MLHFLLCSRSLLESNFCWMFPLAYFCSTQKKRFYAGVWSFVFKNIDATLSFGFESNHRCVHTYSSVYTGRPFGQRTNIGEQNIPQQEAQSTDD